MDERISALLDNALDAQEREVVLDALSEHAALQREWNLHCLLGDALRGELPRCDSVNLAARVMAQLEGEPLRLVASAPKAAPIPAAPAAPSRKAWSALLPIAASVMGVALVGWLALDALAPGGTQPVLAERVEAPEATVMAQSGGPAAVASSAPVLPISSVPTSVSTSVPIAQATAPLAGAEHAHREYLFAHQALAGGAIPGVAHYVRTVAEPGLGSRR